MPTTLTRRMVTEGDLEIRTAGKSIEIEVHAATFNQPYYMGWYKETVAPGAFSRTLGSNLDVTLLVNHDGLPLARTGTPGKPGTLDLAEDESGLYMRAKLDASDPDVMRLVPKMARGDLRQMSFAFGLTDGGDEWSDDYTSRTMRHLNLEGGDVSVVTHPANPNATVTMRSEMRQDPDRFRSIYRAIRESDGDPKAGLTPKMLALLENLDVDGAISKRDLELWAAFVKAPAELRADDADDAAKAAAATAIEHENMRARIALLKLK